MVVTNFVSFVGFIQMFGISDSSATLLSIVPTFATGHGFMWAYCHRLNSMAQSKLFPSILAWRTKENIAYSALLIGSAITLLLAVVMYYVPIMYTNMFSIAITCAFFTYICQCISYIAVTRTFVNVPREFRSPLGVAGAVFSIVIWVLCILGIMIYESDQHIVLITCVILGVLITAYYYGYAQKHQSFSEEEKKILFTAHVINCKYLCCCMMCPLVIISICYSQ
jgi:ethanolamine permease